MDVPSPARDQRHQDFRARECAAPIDCQCLIRFTAFNIGELIFFENEETVFATPSREQL